MNAEISAFGEFDEDRPRGQVNAQINIELLLQPFKLLSVAFP